MQSDHDFADSALPVYFLDTFADSATADATRSHLERFGPFPSLLHAMDHSEALARAALASTPRDASADDSARTVIVRIEVRAHYPDRTAKAETSAFGGVVDFLERAQCSFRWRMGTREDVREEDALDELDRIYRTRDAAEYRLRRAYFDDVKLMAEDLLRAVADGDVSDWNGFIERLEQDVDRSAYVIYYARARDMLRWTEWDGAEMGDEFLHGCSSMSELYTRAAYRALLSDVSECVRAYDVKDLGEKYARTLAGFEPHHDHTYPARRADDDDAALTFPGYA